MYIWKMCILLVMQINSYSRTWHLPNHLGMFVPKHVSKGIYETRLLNEINHDGTNPKIDVSNNDPKQATKFRMMILT